MWSRNSNSGYLSKENGNTSLKRHMHPIFIVPLFTRATIWKQPNCQIDEWIKKVWCVCVCLSVCVCMYTQSLCCVQLCDPIDCSPPGPLTMEFSRQENWCGLPFPTPGHLPDPRIEPTSPGAPAFRRILYHCTTWEAPQLLVPVLKMCIPTLTILKWHGILVLPVDAGNFALHLEEAELHLQEGHLVFSTWMEQLPPCLPGSEHRGHRKGFLSHTQHMVDPQYMAHLATKETSHMQPKHPMWRGRAAGNKNMASWKERRQSRPAGSPAQLPKAWQDKP